MSGHHLRLKDCWWDNRLGGDIGSRAWLFLSDERLAAPIGEPLTNETRGDVGRAASQETNNDAHRPRRISLRPSKVRDARKSGSARCQPQKSTAWRVHGV